MNAIEQILAEAGEEIARAGRCGRAAGILSGDRMKKLPTKKRLRQVADKLWSAAVQADWADKCAVCGTLYDLESHHLIRRSRSTIHRYSLRNGISLCTSHHNFDPCCSPHGGDVGFNSWLRLHHKDIVDWVLKHQHEHMDGKTTSQGWYLERIIELAEYVDEDALRAILGVRLAEHVAEKTIGHE